MYVYMYVHVCTRTRARARARTHTHTHGMKVQTNHLVEQIIYKCARPPSQVSSARMRELAHEQCLSYARLSHKHTYIHTYIHTCNTQTHTPPPLTHTHL